MVYEIEIPKEAINQFQFSDSCAICGHRPHSREVGLKTGFLDQGPRLKMTLPSCGPCSADFSRNRWKAALLFVALLLPTLGISIGIHQRLPDPTPWVIALFTTFNLALLIFVSWLLLRFDPRNVKLQRIEDVVLLSLRSAEAAQALGRLNELAVEKKGRFRSET